jgi:hypothetical protein
MTTQLTGTTGTVKGFQECIDFTNMCNSKFTEVIIFESQMPIQGYLQYTLLTDNRIKIYK